MHPFSHLPLLPDNLFNFRHDRTIHSRNTNQTPPPTPRPPCVWEITCRRQFACFYFRMCEDARCRGTQQKRAWKRFKRGISLNRWAELTLQNSSKVSTELTLSKSERKSTRLCESTNQRKHRSQDANAQCEALCNAASLICLIFSIFVSFLQTFGFPQSNYKQDLWVGWGLRSGGVWVKRGPAMDWRSLTDWENQQWKEDGWKPHATTLLKAAYSDLFPKHDWLSETRCLEWRNMKPACCCQSGCCLGEMNFDWQQAKHERGRQKGLQWKH